MTTSGSYEGHYYGTAIVSVELGAALAADTANAFIKGACDVGTSENVTPPRVTTTTGTGEPSTTALCTTKSASGTIFHTGILVTAAQGRIYTLTMVISTAADATVDTSLQHLLLITLKDFALLNSEGAATPTVTATPTEQAATGSSTPTAGESIGSSLGGVQITSFFTVSKQAYDDWAAAWKQGKPPTAPLNLVSFAAGTQTVAVYFTYRKAVAQSTRYDAEYDDASGRAYCTDPTGPHILSIDTGADMEYCTIPSGFVVGWYTAVLSIDGSRVATTKFSVGQVPGGGTSGATSAPAYAE
jgi:hypothetical protein